MNFRGKAPPELSARELPERTMAAASAAVIVCGRFGFSESGLSYPEIAS
jgi:hypothetical protein